LKDDGIRELEKLCCELTIAIGFSGEVSEDKRVPQLWIGD
jgi:hypothetical protein